MRSFAISVICISGMLSAVGCDRSQRQADQPTMVYSAGRCGGSASGWSPHGGEYGHLMAHNTLAVGSAKLTWNGAVLSAATLQRYLQDMGGLNPEVNLQVVFNDFVDCRLVDQTRALVADKLGCDRRGECVEYSEAAYRAEASRHVVY